MSSIADIVNAPSGSKWLKADLHVHTPASPDMADNWKSSSPEDLVAIAISKGLDIIAITDHNTAEWCDLVSEASNDTSLTVFPGVEITTPQGHVLAIFNAGTPSEKIEDLLIALEIPRAQFGSTNVSTTLGVSGVSDAIENHDGVAIAAHAEKPRGFLTMIPVDKEKSRVYSTPSLRAMEIVDPSLRERYQDGRLQGYSRRMTCIQSSDSWPDGASQHGLDGIGNRFTFLKMDDRSISGLKLALIDPDMRVRLETDHLVECEITIEGMWVTGGFLDDQLFSFSKNVTCLIGDTGAGKSAAIEMMRFCLDQQPNVEKIRQEVDHLLKDQLGTLNTVHVLVKKDGTSYLVERQWDDSPSAPTVMRVTEAGTYNVEGPIDMKLFFPIKAFSQSEIIEFARQPDVRLSLTDDLIDITTEELGIRNSVGVQR